MKKHRECSGHYWLQQKLVRIMKLTSFMILTFVLTVSASSYSQSAKLKLSLKKGTLIDALSQIEDQSDYYFYYNKEELSGVEGYSAEIQDKDIHEVLDKLLEDTNLDYKIIDKYIVVKIKEGSVTQQQIKLSGKVTDTSGQPLPGVTVVVKGTTNGTITNFDGVYTLSNVPSDATIQFSFVGMKMQEIHVNGKTSIDVVMAEDAIGIEEVVAIGYGTMKKSDLTGAVGAVKGELVSERNTTMLSQALQGTIPGVMVTRDNSGPGSTATIRIRGITTIGDSNPLILVDGIPVSDINQVNPNDVENISVLKDGAAASIYGSRAAAGVILVSTKRATAGQKSIEYSFEYGLEKPTKLPEYVGAARYMQMVNELRWNDNGNVLGEEYPTYTKNLIENYSSLHAENPDLYPDVDWQNYILDKYAPRQNHNLNMKFGSKSIKTNVSVNYDEIDGLYVGKNYKRFTVRANNDLTLNKYLNANFDVYMKRAITENPQVDNPVYESRIYAPVYAPRWSDGRIARGKDGENFYAGLVNGGFINGWYNQIGGRMSVNFTPIDGLKISATISPNFNFSKSKDFAKAVTYTNLDDPNTSYPIIGYTSTDLTENRDDDYQITSQFFADYEKSFKNHNFHILAGYENYYAFYENMSGNTSQMDLSIYPYLDLGNVNYLSNNGNAYENAYRSWFGRIMYNYQNKYLLQGNIRFDASSRFASEYRWGTFPSVSAGWVVSEESFMKDINELSFLKLRASWGVLGNERIGNYPYQSTIVYGSSVLYSGDNKSSAMAAAQTSFPVEDITWETTESIDFGIDAYFIDNKLQFSGDIYKKETKDMLLELEIPDYIGYTNPQQNTGKMHTNGWEMVLGWNDQIGELKYSVSANLSNFKSVMGELGGIEFLGSQVKFKGSEYNEWYGYQSDGLYQTQDEVENSAVLNSVVAPGDIKYKDVSGPDGVPDGIISSDYDRVLLGGSTPHLLYGGNIFLGYKNFDLSLDFQGVGKQNVRMETMMVQPLQLNWGNFPTLIDGNYWSHHNTDAENLKAKYPRLTYSNTSNDYAMSDYWLFNGAYFRVKRITLGYNIPSFLSQKLQLKGVRVYCSINDLLSIDKYPKGWDPEVSGSSYPITTSFIFGVNVNF